MVFFGLKTWPTQRSWESKGWFFLQGEPKDQLWVGIVMKLHLFWWWNVTPKLNKAIHKHPDIDMIFGPFLRPGLYITPLVLTAFTAFFRHLEATHVTCWDRQGFGRCFLPLSESNSKVWKSQKTNEGAKVERSKRLRKSMNIHDSYLEDHPS